MNKEKQNDHFNFFKKIWWFFYRKVCSDKSFSKYMLLRRFGRKVNIEQPKTFNEKIQWLKIYDRKPIYKKLSDKYLVKKHIKEKIGDDYVPRLIGVFDDVSSIDFQQFPKSFILKGVHGSGMNIVVIDKNNLDENKCKRKLKKWPHIDYYKFGREWRYKGLKKRIIYEELLLTDNNRILTN
jgi:hypothetical protein